MQETLEAQVCSLGWEDPLEKEMATHSSILAWRIHGQGSLAGYSPWGHKELDMTEWLTLSRYVRTGENHGLFLVFIEFLKSCLSQQFTIK